MSPTLTNCPAVTAMPLSLSAPATGSVVIRTAWKPLAGLSWGSVKPKSARANVYGVSSNLVTDGGEPSGAAVTSVKLTVNGRGVGSRSTPPLPVPPSSCTWNAKLAYAGPLGWGAGVNTNGPAVLSEALATWPAVTAVPLSLSVPPNGSVVIRAA